MPLRYDQIRLDARVVPTSVTFNSGTNLSTVTLPIPATVNRIVRLATGTMGTLTQLANLSGTITGISAANPSVITSVGHGLTTGRVVTITGSNSTPSINGSHTVTVLNTNTFTIPVNVTGAGSTGEWTASDHTVYTVPGNFTGGSVCGNVAPFSLVLSEPIARGESGEPDLSMALVVDRMTVYHRSDTGFSARITSVKPSLWPARVTTWNTSLLTVPAERQHRMVIPVRLPAERCTISIEEATYKPVRIIGIDYELQTMEAVR